MDYSKQKIFCNACGKEMDIEFNKLVGRNYRVCSQSCYDEINWRDALSMMNEPYKPRQVIGEPAGTTWMPAITVTPVGWVMPVPEMTSPVSADPCCASQHWPPDTACHDFERGSNGRCVFCDHELKCHPGPGATCEIGSETQFPLARSPRSWADCLKGKGNRSDEK